MKRSDNIAITLDERHRLIRHHLEEASTHLGMAKQLVDPDWVPRFEAVGRVLKTLYTKHGGHPDA